MLLTLAESNVRRTHPSYDQERWMIVNTLTPTVLADSAQGCRMLKQVASPNESVEPLIKVNNTLSIIRVVHEDANEDTFYALHGLM